MYIYSTESNNDDKEKRNVSNSCFTTWFWRWFCEVSFTLSNKANQEIHTLSVYRTQWKYKEKQNDYIRYRVCLPRQSQFYSSSWRIIGQMLSIYWSLQKKELPSSIQFNTVSYLMVTAFVTKDLAECCKCISAEQGQTLSNSSARGLPLIRWLKELKMSSHLYCQNWGWWNPMDCLSRHIKRWYSYQLKWNLVAFFECVLALWIMWTRTTTRLQWSKILMGLGSEVN